MVFLFFMAKATTASYTYRNTLARHDALPICSTIVPESARKVAQAAKDKSLRMIDAPVSSGTCGAVAGTLTFIVGGLAADLEAARPYLEKMGKNIFHAGEAGAEIGRASCRERVCQHV